MPMHIKKGIAVYAMLMGLTIGVSGFAQSSSETSSKGSKMLEKLQKDCKSDTQKLCKDVTPGEGRIAACLDSKENQLSSGCRETWNGTKVEVSQRLDKADVAFRKNCGKDVQKYCSDVPSGRGRLLNCLDNYRSDLSSSCQKFYSSLEQRLSKLVG
jgi:Golgi apparatus protein 1